MFPNKAEDCLFKSMKNSVAISMRIATNLWIVFGRMVIFTMLILLIHKHRRSFHLLISSSISLFRVLRIFMILIFYLLGQSYPKVFYILEAIVKGVASLVSFCLLLVSRKIMIIVSSFCAQLLC